MSNASDFVIENGVLVKYTGTSGDVAIPDEVKEIGAHTFEGNKKIKNVVLSNGVGLIGYCAFKGCSALETIHIPENVLRFEGQSFSGCTKLKNVVIPNSNAFAYGAFENCRSLEYIKASEETLETIFRGAGDKLKINISYGYLCSDDKSEKYEETCKWFKKKILPIIFENDNSKALSKLFGMYKKPIKINDIDEYLIIAAEKPELAAFLLEYKNKYYSPVKTEKNTELNTQKELGFKPKTIAEWRKVFAISDIGGAWVLENYKIKESSVEIPEKIGAKPVIELQNTFENHEEITSVLIPNSIEIIGWNVFDGTSIEEISIPENVIGIGMFSFANCKNLKKVTFCGNNCSEIDETAFKNSLDVVIHAPAGSFAEIYAKENNIPFVAE